MRLGAMARPRFLLTALAAWAIVAPLAGCRKEPTRPEWKLTWQDEFDGPAGQSPAAANWGYDLGTGGGGWGNNELEFYTARPENVSLDGAGHLVITARKEPYLQGTEYTSARINTRGLFEQDRGRFEARLKLPSGQGLWPAFWLLGADFAATGWPSCGEIDIMECRGQEPASVHGSAHGPGYSGGSALTGQYTLPKAGFDQDFHLFAVEWSTDRITYLVDGIAYKAIERKDVPASSAWVFTHPFFIILNVAVGGNYVGPPDDTTIFPQTMLVDYVRVYAVGP